MSYYPAATARPRQRTWSLWLVAFDAFLLLFPPFHWLAGSAGPGGAIGYFVLSGAAVVASLFLMVRWDAAGGKR